MILVYGLAKGETERYMEDLLSTQCTTAAEVHALKLKAAADGWHSFRVAKFVEDGRAPDFVGAIAGVKGRRS